MNSGVPSGIHQLLTCQGLSLFFLAAVAQFLMRYVRQSRLSVPLASTAPMSNALVPQGVRYRPAQSGALPAFHPTQYQSLDVACLPRLLVSLPGQTATGSAEWFAHSHTPSG